MSQQYTFRMLPLVTSKSWWSVEQGVSGGSLVFVQTAWWWRELEMMTHHDVQVIYIELRQCGRHVQVLNLNSSLNPLHLPVSRQADHVQGLPFGRLCLCTHSLSPLHFLFQPFPRGRRWAIPESKVLEQGWIQHMDPDW